MAPEPYDLIIIGGGPAGLSAAIYAMRAMLKTVIVEKGVPGGQITLSDEVENYPGFQRLSGFELSQKLHEHAAAYDVEQVSAEVTAVEPGLERHTVRLDNGQVLTGHGIILATGGSPRKLGIPGEDENYGKGVSYCAVCDGFFFKGKTVAVVGGGDTAVEEALYLSKLARKVYLVHRRDALRASMLLQERIKADCNCEILWNAVVAEIRASEGAVAEVLLQDTISGDERSLEAQGAFIFIGFEPNNHLVPAGIKRNAEGYVVTDDKCETSIPGIYAVGDLREKYARQIVVAAADGCTAALAAAHYVESRKGVDTCVLPE